MRAWLAMFFCLTACSNSNDLDQAPVYLGNFSLGHNVVIAPNLTRAPASREASEGEWVEALTLAIDDRFARYNGPGLYHFGVSVEGYLLAIPGVPFVVSPKSALSVRLTVWDDSRERKLNSEPKVINVFENISAQTVISSGLLQTRNKQMENLARNVAKQIESWLVKQNFEKGWLEEDGIPVKRKPRGQDVRAFLRNEEQQRSDEQKAIDAAVAEAISGRPAVPLGPTVSDADSSVLEDEE
ncbi:MAG: hypothetical protein AAFQ04_09330 [Pseudomonadota bacterium]